MLQTGRSKGDREMTNAQAAAELEAQAADLGLHSLACRWGAAETFMGLSDGCAPCGAGMAAIGAAEAALDRANEAAAARHYEDDPEAWAETFDPRHPGYRG